jgi:hypothetical protein
LREFYHPPKSNNAKRVIKKEPSKAKITPKKDAKKKEVPVCQFLEAGWCHKWEHVKILGGDARHPPKLIRCPYLDNTDKAGKYERILIEILFFTNHKTNEIRLAI